MKNRPFATLVLVLVVFGFGMAAARLEGSQLSIVGAEAGAPLENLAAREIVRYVYLRTGILASLADHDRLPLHDMVIVARKDRPVLNTAIIPPAVKATFAALGGQEYVLKTIHAGGRQIALIVGGDDVGTLYGAYRFIEHLGVRFDVDGDVIPDQQVSLALPELDEQGKPLFALRGLQPFHDFFEGPDWWNSDDYKLYLSQMAKLRMNFIGLHNYPTVVEKDGTPKGEPTIWIGPKEDIAEDGGVRQSYPAFYANTLRSGWGSASMKTSEYVGGAAMIFEHDGFGPDVMIGHCPWPTGPEESNQVFNRAGLMLRDAFTYAHGLGIKTCIGTETPLKIPKEVHTRLRQAGKDPARPDVIRDIYEGMFQRICKAYPLDYYWLWTHEGWTWVERDRRTIPPEEIEAVKQDIRLANEALGNVKAPFVLGTCGWVLGPPGDRGGFDSLLPKTSPLSCINRHGGHDSIEPAFAAIHGRPLWAIPWLENDGNLIAPQLWVGRMRYDAADALRYGCTGLLGIHWRTKVIGPNVAALAQAGWSQPWAAGHAAAKFADEHNRVCPTEDFYRDWARSHFGVPGSTKVAALFQKIDGVNLPATSEGCPGNPKIITRPWAEERQQYAFVAELESLRDEIIGAGNLDRFDYWLNTFRYMRTMAELGCARGALDQVMARLDKEKDPRQRALLARKEAVPLRGELAALWCRMIGYQLAAVSTVGEMGTIANLEQNSRKRMGFVEQHDKAIAAALGAPLPDEVQLVRNYAGPPRILLPTVRTTVAAGEPLSLKVLLLASRAAKGGSLHWRLLGSGEYREVPLKHVDRAVCRVEIPSQSTDVLAIEYYIHATWDDGKTSIWPVTAPGLNQTVVVHEPFGR